MQVVAEQHLQRVLAGFERNFGLCAAIAEVNMVAVFRDWQTEIGQVAVDQKVMMARMGRMGSSRNNVHPFYSEDDPDRVAERIAISRAYEKDSCAVRRYRAFG